MTFVVTLVPPTAFSDPLNIEYFWPFSGIAFQHGVLGAPVAVFHKRKFLRRIPVSGSAGRSSQPSRAAGPSSRHSRQASTACESASLQSAVRPERAGYETQKPGPILKTADRLRYALIQSAHHRRDADDDRHPDHDPQHRQRRSHLLLRMVSNAICTLSV